ncbi:hypothetical protein VPH35_121084 [Triticum aestivum]
MAAAVRSGMRVGMEEMASLDITIPWSLIGRIKAECGGDCMVFDTVVAFIWQCCTRTTVQAKSGAVAGGDVKDLVKLIRLAKEKILMNGGGADDGGVHRRQQLTPRPSYSKYKTLAVMSWMNIGFDVVDFGRGSPVRVMPPLCKPPEQTAMNVCILCPPCKGKDGVNVVSQCVKPEHAVAFVRELAALGI